MRVPLRRFLTWGLTGPVLVLAATISPATSAQAASTQTICSAGGQYAHEVIMQTSTQWGRAGGRVC